jgi:hypothetical protein
MILFTDLQSGAFVSGEMHYRIIPHLLDHMAEFLED